MSDYDPRALGARCDECVLKGCPGPVPPENNPQAVVAMIGKGPGDDEIRLGKPYSGPAGRELNKALRGVGLSRSRVHLNNVTLCQAPKNKLRNVELRIAKVNAGRKKEWMKACRAERKAAQKEKRAVALPPAPYLIPTPTECCRPRLVAEIAAFRDVVTLGSAAVKSFLGSHASVMKVRGGMVTGHLRYDAGGNEIVIHTAEEDAPPPPGFRPVRLLPTLEPAYVIRYARWTAAFRTDMKRAAHWFAGKLEYKAPTIVMHPDAAQLRAFLYRPGAVYAYDVETDGIECLTASMRCVAIGDGDTVMVVGMRSKDRPPREDPPSPGYLGAPTYAPWYSDEGLAAVLDVLREWFADPARLKVGHNSGFYDRLNVRANLGVDVAPNMDTMMLHRLVESELPHNLGFVASMYAPAVKAWKADRDGRKIALEAESDEELHVYCANDVAQTARVLAPLWEHTRERDQAKLIAKDHRVQAVCAELHTIGMQVDQAKRLEIENDLIAKCVDLRQRLRALSGRPDFNPGSRDQLADLWFKEWGINPPIDDEEIKYTESGAPSVADAVVRVMLSLPDLAPHQREHMVLTRRYKRAQKLLGTYVAKLRFRHENVHVGWDDEDDSAEAAYRRQYNVEKKGVVWADGRVRPGWNAHITNVGRLSSSRPWSAQVVPRWLRVMICAAPGHVLVGADADQFHIRIFSALWQVERYMEALRRGADPHATTADAVFPGKFRKSPGFPGGHWDGDGFFIPDGVGDWEGLAYKQRALGKRVQFASAYRAGVETVHRVITSAEDKNGDLMYLKLALREVRLMRENWLAGLPEIPRGWDQEQALYDAYGYLADPVDGRRKDFLDGATKQDTANYRTLATEAALMNGAMLKVVDAIPWGKWGPSTGLINQCHDSLVLEVPDTGVYVNDKGHLCATSGTPAWEACEVLREALNYDGADFGLPGVRFTSKPTIGRTWATVG